MAMGPPISARAEPKGRDGSPPNRSANPDRAGRNPRRAHAPWAATTVSKESLTFPLNAADPKLGFCRPVDQPWGSGGAAGATAQGYSVEFSAAEQHWREFFQSLRERGRHGMKFVVSDDHAGLKAARQAVTPGAPWQADVLRDVLAEVALADLAVI